MLDVKPSMDGTQWWQSAQMVSVKYEHAVAVYLRRQWGGGIASIKAPRDELGARWCSAGQPSNVLQCTRLQGARDRGPRGMGQSSTH